MNPMRTIRIEKITLNIGAGKDVPRLEKGVSLLKSITGVEPIKTFTRKRIPEWGLRPGLAIGCKVTLRKEKAKQILLKLLEAKEHKLSDRQFEAEGNVAFGIHEYIDIPGVAYDPSIGIMGLEVCVTLERPGFRIKHRGIQRKRLPVRHKIRKEEAIAFMKERFHAKVNEE